MCWLAFSSFLLLIVVGNILNSLGSHQILLCSYDLLRRVSQQSLSPEELSRFQISHPTIQSFLFEIIIADEAHCLRNPWTETSQAVFTLKGLNRLALTGTPVQNRVEDIWSLMNFVMPQFLGEPILDSIH